MPNGRTLEQEAFKKTNFLETHDIFVEKNRIHKHSHYETI